MSVFPGSFTHIELLNMDIRDFNMWHIESLKVESKKKIDVVNSVMLAFGATQSKKGYREYRKFFYGEKYLLRELENMEN